jgi:hypothetical protein
MKGMGFCCCKLGSAYLKLLSRPFLAELRFLCLGYDLCRLPKICCCT